MNSYRKIRKFAEKNISSIRFYVIFVFFVFRLREAIRSNGEIGNIGKRHDVIPACVDLARVNMLLGAHFGVS